MRLLTVLVLGGAPDARIGRCRTVPHQTVNQIGTKWRPYAYRLLIYMTVFDLI